MKFEEFLPVFKEFYNQMDYLNLMNGVIITL